jgi:hypothetical protein
MDASIAFIFPRACFDRMWSRRFLLGYGQGSKRDSTLRESRCQPHHEAQPLTHAGGPLSHDEPAYAYVG